MAPDRRQAAIEALLLSAERHMAQHGIEGADLKAIQRDAGQRNKSAVNYYFGGRDGLLAAVGVKHRAAIDRERMARLDELERAGPIELVDLAAAAVEPLARSLQSQSGRRYLIVLAEAMARYGAAFTVEAPGIPHVDSVRRMADLAVRVLGDSPAAHLRVGHALLVTVTLLADAARGVEADGSSVEEAAAQARSLIGIIAAVLAAPR